MATTVDLWLYLYSLDFKSSVVPCDKFPYFISFYTVYFFNYQASYEFSFLCFFHQLVVTACLYRPTESLVYWFLSIALWCSLLGKLLWFTLTILLRGLLQTLLPSLRSWNHVAVSKTGEDGEIASLRTQDFALYFISHEHN